MVMYIILKNKQFILQGVVIILINRRIRHETKYVNSKILAKWNRLKIEIDLIL